MNALGTSAALLRAAHGGPSVAVTAMAGMLGIRAGLTAPRIALVVGAVLAGQLSVGWLNDWWDVERDTAAGRDDKPVVSGQLSRVAVGRAALTAALACGALSAALGLAGVLNLVTVTSAWLYDVWAKQTRGSVVPYVVSFGLLPAVITLAGRPPAWPPTWMIVAAALLGAGGHFANALPDLESDRRLGVLGLPQRLGPRLSLWIAAAALGAGALIAAGAANSMSTVAVAVAVTLALLSGVVTAALRGRRRTAFRLTMALAVVAVGLLLVP